MKKRILIVSDSIKRRTGYATVARNILKHLIPTNKYTIAQLGLADIPAPPEFDIDYYSQTKDHSKCCNRGNVIEYRPAGSDEIKFLNINPQVDEHENQNRCIKGANANGDHYGYDSVYFVVQHFKPDIVIPINDIWGLYNISHLKNRKGFKFIPYLAIDSECMFPILNAPENRPGLPPIEPIKVIGSTDKTIVFTDWAKDVINKTCKIVTKGKELNNMATIPHGVDTSVWRPLGEEKKRELRKSIFGIDDSVFLLGSIARNQPRKRLDAIFDTLRKFIDKYEDPKRKVMCYFHCALQDHLGWNLLWLAKYYGVEDRCIFDKTLKPGAGPTDEQLNEITNCFDVHLMLTNSEGWCEPEGTLIVTNSGIKPIEKIQKDEIVISHTGKERRVIQPLSREYDGRLIGFKYLGNSSTVWFTPNHRLLVANSRLEREWIPANFVNKKHYLCFPKPQTKEIDTMIDVNAMIARYSDYDNVVVKDDMLIVPKTRSRPFPAKLVLTEDLAELFGNYIAEGSCEHGGIKLSINKTSDEIIRKNAYNFAEKYNLICSSHIMDRNRENVNITSKTLSAFFKSFNNGAHRKRIPIEIFDILKNNKALCKQFINGAFEGDGYCSSKNGLVYTTVSEELAYQMKYLFATLGMYSKIYSTKRKEHRDSFVVQIQDYKTLVKCKTFVSKLKDINIEKKSDNTFIEEDDEYFYIPIRKEYSKEYTGTVYNLSVEDDESYIAEGVAVHNCLPALETAAAGVPNVITNYSAHADWGKGTHLFCKVGGWEHEPRTGFIKAIADTNNAAHQLKLLYSNKKMLKEYSSKGVKLGKKLDWENVCKQWEELIDKVDVSDLEEDRYSSDELRLLTEEEEMNKKFELKSFGDKQ